MKSQKKLPILHRAIILLAVIAFVGDEVAQAAEWYRVDKHAKKGWRESRKWLKKAAKTGVGVDDFSAIEDLANDGLSLAEDGIGDLANFAEDLSDEALAELQSLSAQMVEAVVNETMGEMEPHMKKTASFLEKLYSERPDLAVKAVDRLSAISDGGSPMDAYEVYQEIHAAFPEFQELIHEVTLSGHFNTSILFGVAGAVAHNIGGGAGLGLAIKPSDEVNFNAIYSFGGTAGLDMANAGGGLFLGFAVEDPEDVSGPGLSANVGWNIGPVDAGGSVEISLPKIKGSFPDFDLIPPEFSSFTVSVGGGAGIPIPSLTVGAGYTAIIKGSRVYFDPDAPKPQDYFGSDENDHIDGSEAKDTIYGLGGDDSLNGHDGDDIIEGGDGNDVINPGGGKDTMYGEDGDDRFNVGWGTNYIHCGNGYDVIVFPKKKNKYTIKKKDNRVNIRQKDGRRNHFIYFDCERVEFKKGSYTIN